MFVTVCLSSEDKTWSFDIGPDITLQGFKTVCSSETGIPDNQMELFCNNTRLTEPNRSLKDYGIGENDIILLTKTIAAASTRNPTAVMPNIPKIDFSKVKVPTSASSSRQVNNGMARQDDPARVREWFLNNPHDLALIKERNPPLAEALLSGDLNRFAAEYNKIKDANEKARLEQIKLLNANPMDPEVQKKIAAEIERKNIEENMNMAIEEAPESFGQVVMLWINLKVNNHHVKAFVDSGAQMTIMSSDCAKRCNIMRLVDTRWEGVAKGVGTQKILGRIHLAQIQIEDVYLQCSFSVLEDQPMDVLLGLDMLRRHLCVIDLRENSLIIGTSQTRTKFLAERDLPVHGRLHNPNATPETQKEEEAINKALLESVNDAKQNQESEKKAQAEGVSNTKIAKMDVAEQPTTSSKPTKPAEFYANIRKLVDMGFNELEAEAELNASGGDLQKAVATMLSRNTQN
nr:protein DDI1 homolog 2 [Ciona intestinalis]|eukprot:XP_002124336.3 protein DDI1 homolog 2 [Ciona intestinalis]